MRTVSVGGGAAGASGEEGGELRVEPVVGEMHLGAWLDVVQVAEVGTGARGRERSGAQLAGQQAGRVQ